MKRKILILSLLLSGAYISLNAQISAIVGEWKTVDDKTGEIRAVVQIYKGADNLYHGKIIKMFKYADAVCEKCEGADKDKPVLGMIIIRAMKADGDVLKDGYLLDPESGKKYYGTISFDAKTGKLKLRGSLDKRGWIGRNQYWVK
ncbi:MAG: DUF2147 domain-containing protein [Dysgonamonadaceae bacterium]|jgi:uncharacterized protein (DUF2147 family)|nr:DUF2147 domain-containing protein [Dysgonamonadaceae bacterium]